MDLIASEKLLNKTIRSIPGARRVENETEIVAFKEEPKGSFFEKLQHLKSEKELYERIGSHGL